jgi:two-component system LytT family sensor kinase
LKANRRYHFWKVFWVTLAVYFFGMVIGVAFASLSPISTNEYKWEKLLEWKRILSQVTGFLFSVFFFYFTLNKYYRLFAAKRVLTDFIRYTAGAFLIMAVYLFCSYYFVSGKTAVAVKLDSGVIQTKALTVNDSLHVNDSIARLNTGSVPANTTADVNAGRKSEGKNETDSLERLIKEAPVALLILSIVFSIIFQIGLSILIAYLTYLRDEKKQRKVLEEQKMQLEVEKSQANFNFLKAQINPHFLHNTLNFLYAKSLPYSPELSEGILTLSEIMRYALSEGNAKDGKAPLKDEIEHVRNVIKINQLRFSNKLNVKFDVEGVVNGAEIIPFVLITLVENAFKHGDLKSNNNPIEVNLKVDSESIYFFCRNKKKMGPRELSTGIGLDNIRKRLDLAYGKKHSFIVKDEADIYTTELTISRL